MSSAPAGHMRGVLRRLRHPKSTVRWRLALLYGGLFLGSGAALLAITYGLVEHATITDRQHFVSLPVGPGAVTERRNLKLGPLPPSFKRIVGSPTGRALVRFGGDQQRIADLHQLEIESAIALTIMAIIAAGLGWVVAGRVLRPLREITATTQQISEANLHERLALPGPRDELRELADTIDGLLGRLETAFDAQRRFVANASHELRTPLTVTRALLEMVMSDPQATLESFRAACRQVLEESAHQEELIDALLTLARSQRGIARREAVELSEMIAAVIAGHDLEARVHDVRLEGSLQPAVVPGDRRLLERLVVNLVQNAIRHNRPDGHARVELKPGAGEIRLTVSNSGPIVPPAEIERLLQPFQRLAPERVGTGNGLGLGLSIVAAIADVHQAKLVLQPAVSGGLVILVRFPAARGEPAPSSPPMPAAQGEPLGDPLGG